MSSAGRSLSIHDATERYLAGLEGSASTQRQRRWALRDLCEHAEEAGRGAAHDALQPEALAAWLTAREAPEDGRPASVAGVRARASAARALTEFVRSHHLVPGLADPADALSRPDTAAAVHDPRAGRYLLSMASSGSPWGVPAAVWARFSAHVHLLAATGAGENDLARLRVEDLAPGHDAVTLRTGTVPLSDPARRSLDVWLAARTDVVRRLSGSDPAALWIRIHPGKDRRTGVIAPAGLAISARGLRLSFQTVRAALAAEDPRVAEVSVRDVRALGRLEDARA
ncbi:hypothetical protein [Cellulomonas cellasea]|uniref:Core-binding (CB) domain-containing protein n=2 Tax=Cellulomonas cellasea TaxID=43670 RepID=A0A0A0BA19_9CELL|nr:hypothetical protein [Cellulomonas cellasea]KGM02993.1 hypothetical protein Q760_10045 [Cellulomonas cellasea DSM 20118]GEA88751.1 hypothetical protein CCE01nite_27000 [Cellulomonas cellasea]